MPQVATCEIREVVPYLFVGDQKDYSNLLFDNIYEIKAVITAYSKVSNIAGIKTYRFERWCELKGDEFKIAEQTNKIILKYIKRQENILICCKSGFCEAPFYAAAYIIWSSRLPAHFAIKVIQIRKPNLNWEKPLIKKLHRYAKKVLSFPIRLHPMILRWWIFKKQTKFIAFLIHRNNMKKKIMKLRERWN